MFQQIPRAQYNINLHNIVLIIIYIAQKLQLNSEYESTDNARKIYMGSLGDNDYD